MSTQTGSLEQFFRDGEEPIFEEPWMARAFALTVELHRQGVFTWSQWSVYLADAINSMADEDGVGYYESWLQALENLLRDKEVVDSMDYAREIRQLLDTVAAPDH